MPAAVRTLVRAWATGAALLALAGVAGACGGARAGEPAPAPGPTVAPSHLRMIAALDEVERASWVDNAFFGRNQVGELEAQLAALPAGVPDLRHWLYHGLLARHELRLGHPEKGVEHALAAYRELERFRGEIPPEKVLETVFQTGVAYLRLGEVQNCARRHNSESCILPIRGGGVHVDTASSTQSLRYFTEVLEHAPRDGVWYLRARWLLNISYMTLGKYPDGVPVAYRIPPAVFESDEAFPHFREIAPQLGLATFDLAGGSIVDDFDGDGLLDILQSTSDTSGSMHVFWNEGGRFTDGTVRAGLDRLRGGLNMVHADYDNDGDLDVLVLRGAWQRAYGRHPKSLLRNNGDRTFTDVTFDAGLGDVYYPSQTAVWDDYDLDGDLDVYVGNERDANVDAPCQLFRNEGGGRFVDVARQAGVTNGLFAKGVAAGDYDNDRYPDLYVSNLGGYNRLYRNNRDGKFTDVAREAGVERPISSFATWFWDYDNDGRLDLYVGAYGGVNLPPDVADVAASYLGLPTQAEHGIVYRGTASGRFEAHELPRITLPMGANFGDLDNDGYLDMYLGTGYPYYEGLIPNIMYRNLAGRGFADVTTAGGFGHLQKGHGISFADLDHDGDQDVYINVGGNYPGDGFANALFENPGAAGHWLKVRLVGTRSNRFGVGARIRIGIREGGAAREIQHVVSTGGSFGGNPLRQEIGLGQAERIDVLEVYWPASDTRQTFRDLPVDRAIEIREGADAPRVVPLKPAAFAKD